MEPSPKLIIKSYLGLLNATLIIIFILTVIILNYSSAQQVSPTQPSETKMVEKTKGVQKQKPGKPNQFSMKDTIIPSEYIPTAPSTNQSAKISSRFNTLAWIPFWDQQRAFSSFQKNYDQFKYISLFWYCLRSDGSTRKYIYAVEDKSIIRFSHSKNVKVLALIANLPDEDEGGDWDFARVDKVINNKTARNKHISDLVVISKRLEVDGINIDYEALKGYQKENFTQFIKELSAALHKNGKILAVALHSKKSEGDPAYSNGSEAQDWRELGKYADQLHLMTYDEHWNTSTAGSIASIPWVRAILTYAKTLIPKEKIFAGVPLYGYDWSNAIEARGLEYTDVLNLIKKYNPKISWDNEAKSHFFGYRDGSSVSHTVWFEDKDSFQAKLDLFSNLGISNIALWRLGGEDLRVWKLF